MMTLEVEVDATGPMFDARGPNATRDYTQAAVDEVAQKGKDQVDRTLIQVIRNPTPIYQTRIQIERAGTDRIINDGGIVYGPWLEGVGSKNKTTRFKGYFTFRQTKQWLDKRTPQIIKTVLGQYIGRLR